MKMIIKIFFVFFLISNQSELCFAQFDPTVKFDSLVQKADAIILEDNVEVEIPDNSGLEYTVSRKILIKNSKADKHCRVVVSESHFIDVEDIDATLTEMDGELIKELDSDEIKEEEYSADAFYSGDKYKYFEMQHHSYPFIFNYQYKVKIKTLLMWPDWYPQNDIPSYSSMYKVNINPEVKFRYSNKGTDITPKIKTEDSYQVYTWRLKNIPTTLEEDFLPPEHRIQTAVYFDAEEFQTDSYSGNTRSWEGYSNWLRKLYADRYMLSNEAIKEIQDLIKGVTDRKEIIRILYKHLQKKNRYVAIEMGLAGWQPQPAEQVYRNRYGDCKDLSNFMTSMLRVAGIKSFPAHALTRNEGVVDKERPSNQFNHCIVCVPLEKDTVWLECTSTYDEMDDIPYTIEDIEALVVSDEKGELIRTPQKKFNQNSMISVFNGIIEITGDLKFDAKIETTGNQKDYIKNSLARLNTKDDNVLITNLLSSNYSNLTVEKFSSDELTSENNRSLLLSVNGLYHRFLPQLNDRIFITPSIINRKSAKHLPKEEIGKRKFPFYFIYPYQDIDTVYIKLPHSYKLESQPKNKTIEKSFAGYYCEYDFKDGKLFYVRRFELLQNNIPLSLYPEFYEFMKQVIEADKSKFVFKKS